MTLAFFFFFRFFQRKVGDSSARQKTEPFWMYRPKASVNPPTFPVMCCQRSSLRLCLDMTVQSLPVWDWRNLIQPDTLVRLWWVFFFPPRDNVTEESLQKKYVVKFRLRFACMSVLCLASSLTWHKYFSCSASSHHSVAYLPLKRKLLIRFSWHVLTCYFAYSDSKAQVQLMTNCTDI